MKKEWKKFSSIFLTAMILTTMTPMVTFATEADESEASETEAESNDMRLIYADTPDDWENPCVWAWNEDGDTAFSAWPGEQMDEDKANDGWNYLYVPDWADHVIINANAGEVQTEEIVLEEGNAWITIADAENVEVSTEQKTTGDIPKYVETFKVHASVDSSWENPCLWAWSAPDGTNVYASWPGEEMTAGEEGWYTTKVPTWVNSLIVNANAGEVQTEDISVDPSELWLTVAEDGTYEISYVDPALADIPNITVYVKTPTDWNTPNLWAWSAPDGTNVFTTWPGEALEENGDWLTKEIPGWVNSIIINGNEGEVQTSDISIETGKDVWVVVSSADEYEVYYEEPEVADVSSEGSESSSSSNLPIVGGVAAAVIVVGGVTAFAINKKKKSA